MRTVPELVELCQQFDDGTECDYKVLVGRLFRYISHRPELKAKLTNACIKNAIYHTLADLRHRRNELLAVRLRQLGKEVPSTTARSVARKPSKKPAYLAVDEDSRQAAMEICGDQLIGRIEGDKKLADWRCCDLLARSVIHFQEGRGKYIVAAWYGLLADRGERRLVRKAFTVHQLAALWNEAEAMVDNGHIPDYRVDLV